MKQINKLKINGETYQLVADDANAAERLDALEAYNHIHLINANGMAIATKTLVETPGFYTATPKTSDLALVSNGELYALTVTQDEAENLAITATLIETSNGDADSDYLALVQSIDEQFNAVNSELTVIKFNISELEQQVGGGTGSAGGAGLTVETFSEMTEPTLAIPNEKFTNVKFATVELISLSGDGESQSVAASWMVPEGTLMTATMTSRGVKLPTQTVSLEDGSDTIDVKHDCTISQDPDGVIRFTPNRTYLPDRTSVIQVVLYK